MGVGPNDADKPYSGRTGEETPFEGGSQPVPEEPTRAPGEGRGVIQTIVVVVAVLVLLAVVIWLIAPFGG